MEGQTQDYGGIGWAVKQMLDGHQMKRKGWNPMGPEWVAYVPAGSTNIPQKFAGGAATGPFLVAKLQGKGVVSWTVTHSDLMARDWQLVGSPLTQTKGSHEVSSLQPTET